MGDYPSEEDLKFIREFNVTHQNVRTLFDYIQDCWWNADILWSENQYIAEFSDKPMTEISFSTGGWSGNESLIHAMRENKWLWSFYWYSSTVGGHYVFKIITIKEAEIEEVK